MNRQGLLSTTGLILVALIIGLTLHEWEDRMPMQKAPELKGPSLVVEGARAQSYDEDGALRYTLDARQLTRFEDAMRTEIEQPDLEVLRPDQRWTVRAERGEIQGPDNDLVLRGNVDARRHQGEPLRLLTSELYYFPARDFIEAPNAVTLEHQGGHTEAGRMEVKIAEGLLKLEAQVESHYEAPAS